MALVVLAMMLIASFYFVLMPSASSARKDEVAAGGQDNMASNAKFHYPLPGLFLFFTFLIYVAMYAPSVYAYDSVDLPSRTKNALFFIFTALVLANGLYFANWLKVKRRFAPTSKERHIFIGALGACFAAALLLCTPLFRGGLTETSFWQCFRFIYAKEAQGYKEEMDLRTRILLDDSAKDVIIPHMKPAYGPFVLDDDSAWKLELYRAFYGKDSVVYMEHSAWHELYGDKWQ